MQTPSAISDPILAVRGEVDEEKLDFDLYRQERQRCIDYCHNRWRVFIEQCVIGLALKMACLHGRWHA